MQGQLPRRDPCQAALFLVSLFGGLAPGAVDHIRALSRRSIDNTEYELDIYCDHIPDRAKRHRTNDKYVQFWTRRMSSAAVMAERPTHAAASDASRASAERRGTRTRCSAERCEVRRSERRAPK